VSKVAAIDWDSIREALGFRVGDSVRARGQEVGIIRNLIQVEDGYRARVYWPTIPFECEGMISPGGSEQFIDLCKLARVPAAAGEQLALELMQQPTSEGTG